MQNSTIGRLLCSVRNVTMYVPVFTVALDLPCRAQDIVTGKDVRVAWAARGENIKSFQYECELRETLLNVKRVDPLNPFANIHDEEVPDGEIVAPQLLLYKTMTFSLDGDKIAYLLQGEQWDANSTSRRFYRFRAVFDGPSCRRASRRCRHVVPFVLFPLFLNPDSISRLSGTASSGPTVKHLEGESIL